MNQKLCKKLHREAVFQLGEIPTLYETKLVNKTVIRKGKDITIQRPIVILGNCTRKLYQQLKKERSVINA
jgi:glycine cleavage system protein P-like pyridoxal-binding family